MDDLMAGSLWAWETCLSLVVSRLKLLSQPSSVHGYLALGAAFYTISYLRYVHCITLYSYFIKTNVRAHPCILHTYMYKRINMKHYFVEKITRLDIV